MAIYRPPRSRWRPRLIAALVGLAIGAVVVAVLAGGDEETAADRAARARAELAGAAGVLEVAGIEYEESVRDGEVVAEAEYEGALAALERSRTRFEGVRRDLPAGIPVDEIGTAFDRAEQLMNERVPAGELLSVLEELEGLLLDGGPS